MLLQKSTLRSSGMNSYFSRCRTSNNFTRFQDPKFNRFGDPITRSKLNKVIRVKNITYNKSEPGFIPILS